MATHYSIPAWRIPRTEEPGGLRPLGSQESDTAEQLSLSPFCSLQALGLSLFFSLSHPVSPGRPSPESGRSPCEPLTSEVLARFGLLALWSPTCSSHQTLTLMCAARTASDQQAGCLS